VGVAKKILAFKSVDPVSTFYSNYAAIEIAESIHLHWRNARIEFDAEEFEVFCKMAQQAYLTWLNHGKPANVPLGQMLFLGTGKLHEEPSRKNPSISSNEVRVEVQQWADYIHLHWKWLRTELTFQEFVDLAEAMSQSLAELKASPWYATAPRRVGTCHQAVPKGRVDHDDPSKEFWVRREDAHDWIGYDSYYLDGQDKQLKTEEHAKREGQTAVAVAVADKPKVAAAAAAPANGMARPFKGFVTRRIAKELVKLCIPNRWLEAYRSRRDRRERAKTGC